VVQQPKHIFLKWMLNDMGAFMSLARGNPLNPAEFMAEGFYKRKRGQVAKLYKKRMIELFRAEPEAKRQTKLSRTCKK
jgi:hypothetical protein